MTDTPYWPKPSSILAALLCALIATTANAQYWPLPSRQPNVTVACPAGSACEGKSTAPYAPPLQFSGRALDSWWQGPHQDNCRPIRTLRAWNLRNTNGRTIARLGSWLVRWDNFYARIAAGEALMPITQMYFLQDRAQYPEILLRPQANFYPETDPAWRGECTDGDVKLLGFDLDDRGNVFPRTSQYGWGVLNADLQTLYHEAQIDCTFGLVRRAGGRYARYCAPQGGPTRVYDVTDTSNGRFLGTVRWVPSWSANATNGDAAIIDDFGQVRIFSAGDDALTNGRIERGSGSESFWSVASDGAAFYAVEYTKNGETEVAIFEPPTYARHDVGIGVSYSDPPPAIAAGAGYVAVYGHETAFNGNPNVRLFRLVNGSLVSVPLLVGAGMGQTRTDQYLPNYYSVWGASGAPGFAAPPIQVQMVDSVSGEVTLENVGGVVHITLSGSGLLDDYTIGTNTPPVVVAPPDGPPVTPPTTPPVTPPVTLDTTTVRAFLATAANAIAGAQAALSGTVVMQPPATPPVVQPPVVQPPVQPPQPPVVQPLPPQPPPPPTNLPRIGDPCDRSTPLPDGYWCQNGRIAKL